jgi:hypothetical protein
MYNLYERRLLMYTISIADYCELTAEVKKVEFNSQIPQASEARASAIEGTITITGRISYDADKPFMKDSTKALAEWSLVKPDSMDAYKEVVVTFGHTGLERKYTLSHAFVVSFHEQFEDQDGSFTLVIRQKKDRLDGITVE